MRRSEILNGTLLCPQQIVEIVENETVIDMFESLWHIYLMKENATTSGPYWSERFDDDKAFNTALYHLSKAGWITSVSIPGRNWSTIQLNSNKLLNWVTKEELLEVRKEFKFNRYKMRDTKSSLVNIVKTPKGQLSTGLVRRGIAKSGNSKFRYDTKYLSMYRDEIIINTTKSIRAAAAQTKATYDKDLVVDGADYESLSTEIVDYHMYSPDQTFTMGNSLIDSRGRAISTSLSKVFNPIGYKDARALLIGPEVSLGLAGYGQVFLFIAELLGDKPKTIKEKIHMGKLAYDNRTLNKLDLDTQEGLDDLHENIWLERIYDMFDTYDGSNWNVPIEIDMTASVIGIEGVLLNAHDMLDEVNLIGDELKDVWSKGMPRKQFKFAATPLLYGSTQHCTALWKKKKIKYTLDHVKIHENELKSGVLGIANDFKDYIIDNVDPKPEMRVKVFNDEFTVYANRYHNIGDYVQKYPVYDTADDIVKTVNHTHTKRVADLNQFKRYFVTLLVHGLDSQLMDRTVDKLEWSIPIYDAIVLMPNESQLAKDNMVVGLEDIRANRTTILGEYFTSIGMTKTVGNMKIWKKLKAKIKELDETTPLLSTCMK